MVIVKIGKRSVKILMGIGFRVNKKIKKKKKK